MDCASEESEIRRALEPIAGLSQLRFDLGQRELSFTGAPDATEMAVLAMRRIGYSPDVLDAGRRVEATGAAALAGGLPSGLPRLIAALAAAIVAELLAYLAPAGSLATAAQLLIAALAIGLAGFGTYQKGLQALLAGRLNINALMTVAVSGAFLIGQWPEAAMVMALYALAELIEARAVDRARNAIRELLDMAPADAEVRQADGQWRRVPTASVIVGAVVRLRPGERVPLDGKVSAGASAVDQAPVTGESVPVDKGVGDPLFAGTINQHAALEFQVTALASDSTLARIIHAVEEAQASRAPTQRFVERFAAIYTPAIFVLALAVALLMPWVMNWTWLEALYKALVLLVIACPCALVISTPVTVVSGLAAAARRGILIKGGVHLERARDIRAVALDKTGTLTAGKPKLVAFEPTGPEADRTALAVVALSLASRSDHPVSQAIAGGLAAQAAARELEHFAAEPGRGVSGTLAGTQYVLANHRWIEERGQCGSALESAMATHEQAGRTATLLANEERVLALFAVADTLKASSAAAVAELRELGVVPVMLTGDNLATAQAIAKEAGLDQVRANLLPQDKQVAIQELQKDIGPTAMVGDGINDAPALAQSDLGVAMGGAGTHTAMEAADLVVMNDDLRRLPEAIRLLRRTHAVLWQNIALALGIKAVFLVAAVFGSASMWMAVFADMGASLLVIFNGLRLLRVKAAP